jgi:hypothetical protein
MNYIFFEKVEFPSQELDGFYKILSTSLSISHASIK